MSMHLQQEIAHLKTKLLGLVGTAKDAVEKAVKSVFPDPEPEPTAAREPGEDTQEILVEKPPPAGGWNLNRIERLVEANAETNPGRVDEWRYYLLYLREFAEIGGALPNSFDRLVWDAFGDLLAVDAVPASV